MDLEAMGARLASLRIARGESQQQVADNLKVKRETVKFWESGGRQIKGEDIVKIAQYFGVSSDYILGLSSAKSPNGSIQEISKYTGLCSEAIDNLHTEMRDPKTIDAVNAVLGSDYDSLHNLFRAVYLALNQYVKFPPNVTKGRILPSLDQFLEKSNLSSEDRLKFFAAIDEWGGDILTPIEMRDYYAQFAANGLKRIIENIGKEMATPRKWAKK